MKKTNALIIFAFILGLCPVYAADDDSSPAVVDKNTKEKIETSGKQMLNDMKSAFQKATDTLDKQMKSITSKACIGKWQFVNGRCTTSIECLEDGTMEYVQKKDKDVTLWRGSYSSTATEIQFHVLQKESKAKFAKKTDMLNEYWIITYKVSGDEEMKLSSPALPHDANEYDFSNTTLFVKQ